MQRSFSEVLVVLISYIFFITGFLHLIFPKEVGIFIIHGADGQITSLIQQFLGTSYLLISVLLYLNRKKRGKELYIIIGSINIVEFIHFQ